MEHLSIKVFGKVQGVFFRKYTREKAVELGLTGWVKNHENGNVIIEVEGDKAAINSFVEWCKKGPPLAKVSAIEVTKGELKFWKEFVIEQ